MWVIESNGVSSRLFLVIIIKSVKNIIGPYKYVILIEYDSVKVYHLQYVLPLIEKLFKKSFSQKKTPLQVNSSIFG